MRQLCTAALLVGTAASANAQQPASVSLEDRTAATGIEFRHHSGAAGHKYLIETMGGGVALLDADGDGWLDILFVNSGDIVGAPAAPRVDRSRAALANRLYRNERNGRFSDITAGSGLSQQGETVYGMGAATGDYDNDGDTDLLITGFPSARLYRNEGDGTFTDVTDASGVDARGWTASAGFADLNADGLLDLVITRYLDWGFDRHVACGGDVPSYCPPGEHEPVTSLLFANRGGGRFEDVSEVSGLAALPGKALGVAFNDIEPDGDLDIVIANDAYPQQLLRNDGGFAFSDIAVTAGVAYNEDGGRFAGMGIVFEDYDNDGLADVLITNLSRELYALYRNDGGGLFTYLTRQSGLATITATLSGWGVQLADFDLDGWKDLFAAQGHVLDTIQETDPSLSYLQPPLLALGSDRRFTDVSAQSGEIFAEPLAGRGAAFGDLDNDGDIDVVVGVLDDDPKVLYNDAADNGGRWIALRLIGRQGPSDGQGARVTVRTPDGPQQHRIASAAGSYLSASDGRVHFGLGANESVAQILVCWPSGTKQELRQVATNQILTVSEDQLDQDRLR